MKKTFLIIFGLLGFGGLKAQTDYTIIGSIYDEDNSPVSLATVALYNLFDSALIAGTISDNSGRFEIKHTKAGAYWLAISFISYKPLSERVVLQDQQLIDLGALVLLQTSVGLSEASVVGERIKARQHSDKTVFYVDKSMQNTSNTGIDMVKYLPGCQVDLFQNISLEGKQNVLIQVNGLERNASFLNQINSADIDKIEINNNPGPEFSSEISGVINVILKKDKNEGLNGHLYAELPVKNSEVYSFPSASINYSYNKMNIYSSYNGEFSYFDIEAQNHKVILQPELQVELYKSQEIHQKNWSHQFNLGFDYFLNDRNQLNFYGFVNPYSNEHDGKVTINIMAGNSQIDSLVSIRDDKDRNISAFASMYYKHIFQEPSKELTFDFNYYNFSALNSTILSDPYGKEVLENTLKPTSQAYNFHLRFGIPFNQRFELETGIKESVKLFNDAEWISFNYRETVSAAYASLLYSGDKLQITGGIRVEFAKLNSGKSVHETLISGLPNFNAKYDLSNKGSIKLTYRKALERPHIYQLNPHSSPLDPFLTQKGNPGLTPAIQQGLTLDYSVLLNSSLFSAGAFYSCASNILENITLLNDSLRFETTTQNAGTISHIGFKVLGSLKLLKNISFSPFLKVFHVQTQGNELALDNRIENKNSFGMESRYIPGGTF